MSSYSLLESTSFGTENWCFQLRPLYKHGLLTSLSNGEVHLLDWNSLKSVRSFKAGETAVNGLRVINGDFHNESVFVAASMNSVKLFDVRLSQSEECVGTITNETETPILSLDSCHDKIAYGTELKGIDAELHIFDIRKLDSAWKSFIDSHHDDITCIQFNPSDPQVLLSGSTDGYANIYDLAQDEEDDSLHQVINYASIHSCGWLAPRRIFTLSHMETFAIHELNDKSDVLKEPQPLDFGDIRQKWDCDYVVDIYPGYIATGKSHEEDHGELKIIPFDINNESVIVQESITLPNAHGNEVVRDILIPTLDQSLLYSCGEDGAVRMWKNSNSGMKLSSPAPEQFWDYSKRYDVLEGPIVEPLQETETMISGEEPNSIPDEKKEDRKKHKKHKKDKKNKKHSKANRYKPY